MQDESLLAMLLDLAEKLGITVRYVALGGDGGGLCTIRGQTVLFVDNSASMPDRIAQTAEALGRHKQIEQMFLLPQVREIIEKYKND